jgi:hypothetical protein
LFLDGAAGFAGFALASSLFGLALTATTARGSTCPIGALATLVVPQVLALVQTVFPARERGFRRQWHGARRWHRRLPLIAGLSLQNCEAGVFGLMAVLAQLLPRHPGVSANSVRRRPERGGDAQRTGIFQLIGL